MVNATSICALRVYLLLFFFSYSPPDHRDLHSFPTRRSSDLGLQHLLHPVNTVGREHFCHLDGIALGPGHPAVEMAEIDRKEHTSELQSHSDLVCRLLLEKKKFNIYSYSIFDSYMCSCYFMCT